jgi:ABC-type multidrug transport system ATPase subunit
MLQLSGISVRSGAGPEAPQLLQGLDLAFPARHFGAIVGPSGCGKSTLLKTIAGLMEHHEGILTWQGREVGPGHDLDPSELGYVPQFSIFHEDLDVGEIVLNAVRLRRGRLGGTEARAAAQAVLEQTGLLEIAGRRARFLSGGQRRRLGLAMELVSQPALLLADEVTSGLDPKSEDAIVRMLRGLADGPMPRIVLSVTHSLRHLDLYDSVTVLHEGRVAYHGPSGGLMGHFGVTAPEDVFPTLAEVPLESRPPSPGLPAVEAPEAWPEPAPHAPALRQFVVLLQRRWTLFFRERGQALLHLMLLAIFPCLVVLFATKGLPEIRNMSLAVESDVVKILAERLEFTAQLSQVGSLVSGLIMFQVILLSLMGANNGAREIAAERLIFEKEKLSGLRLLPSLGAKACFLAVLVAAQSAWMAVFVKTVCRLPGEALPQFALLALVNAAMTAGCLAISAWSRSAEQASLISVYMVGFQLPLSGAVLALPEPLGALVRPLIPAYWSWSGFLQTLRETRFYDLVTAITSTPLSGFELCVWILAVHIVFGLVLAAGGMARSSWGRAG